MKKILTAFAAVVFSGAIAFASSISNFSGPSEPSQVFSYLNQLIGSIQTGVNGIVANGSGAVASTATTAEQVLATTTIPANTLSRAGQSLRLRCSGNTVATSHANTTMKLYYGTSAITTAAATTAGQMWDLALLVTYNASATSAVYVGTGAIGTTLVAPVATANTTDDMSTALTAKCTTTQGTASAGDVNMYTFLVEQVK